MKREHASGEELEGDNNVKMGWVEEEDVLYAGLEVVGATCKELVELRVFPIDAPGDNEGFVFKVGLLAIVEVCRKLRSRNLIVGFDFDAKVFVEIKVPADLGSKGSNVLVLASRLGMLSVLVVEEKGNLSLWVMEEYGVDGSWSNRFVMSFNGVARRIRSLRKNGEIVLEQNG
ncbi:hypothetical protein Droror1_Dr00020523 [Drosera rotundifolia]